MSVTWDGSAVTAREKAGQARGVVNWKKTKLMSGKFWSLGAVCEEEVTSLEIFRIMLFPVKFWL